uniref:F-box domain-containing protein n=1 Tax=Anopheles farauti TaxID=69004 RepID=A0A182QH67_9DIPT
MVSFTQNTSKSVRRMDPPSKARIPLTNVSNNVSQRMVKHIQPYHDQSQDPQLKDTAQVSEELFFMYRKSLRKTPTGCEDLFSMLSDEMLLQIFKWLPKKTLLNCGQVNRRFNRVSKDETLWYRLDLGGRTLQYDGLSEVLNRGTVVLRMAHTTVVNPTQEACVDFPEYVKVKYLDLSMCIISKPVLRALLGSCRSLVKLSLESVPLDGAICAEIAENRCLDTLNLTMCSGIDATAMRAMTRSLTKLHNFNVSWTYLSKEALQELVNNVTPQMLHLNVAGCRSTLNDDDLASLIKRCPKLVSLDLSDCTPLTSAAINIICKARKIEYLSLSRCYNIQVTSYLKLTELRTLRFLDLFGLLSDTVIETLRSSLGDVGINRYYHSFVARPTVGTKRTSIWGLRTRD